jgi:hypothetical protein
MAVFLALAGVWPLHIPDSGRIHCRRKMGSITGDNDTILRKCNSEYESPFSIVSSPFCRRRRFGLD